MYDESIYWLRREAMVYGGCTEAIVEGWVLKGILTMVLKAGSWIIILCVIGTLATFLLFPYYRTFVPKF